MSLTNPTRLINLQELAYFETKLAAKYQTLAISATGITASTVVGALEELASSITSLPSAIIPKGTKAFAGLDPTTDLAAANVGFMWNITDAFTTTSDFAEGTGHSIPAGANVYVANVGTTAEPSYKYDIFSGMYDLSVFKTIDSLKSKGGATQPIYFDSDGNAQNCTYTLGKSVPADAVFTDTTYESLAAASGGTAVSLVTTGEKYAWNAKYDLPSGGIPKTDLAQAVQNSLDAADNAVSDVKVKIGTGAAASVVTSHVAELTFGEGTSNGTIKVAGSDVAVHGLGDAAFLGVAVNADIDEIFPSA